MVGRWAGIRGPGRKNRNPQESVVTRGDHHPVSVRPSIEKCVRESRLNLLTEFPNVKDTEIDEDSDVVLEPAKSIPVHDKCEVLVVGGGPSGDNTV